MSLHRACTAPAGSIELTPAAPAQPTAPVQRAAEQAPARSTASAQGTLPAALHVCLLDQLCFTPWYTAALAQALVEAGVSLQLIAAGFDREPYYFLQRGLSPRPGPQPRSLPAALASRALAVLSSQAPQQYSLLRSAARAAEALLHSRRMAHAFRSRQLPAHVLHLQQLPLLNRGFHADFHLIASAQSAGIPVVHTVHNVLPHDTGDRLRTVYTRLYRSVDHLICHSPQAAQALARSFSIDSGKITVIPHGPLFAPSWERDPSQREQQRLAARARLNLPPHAPIALWQGILAPYKGTDLLLRAWMRVLATWQPHPAGPPLLLFAGSGPAALQQPLRSAAAASQGSIRADLAYIPSHQLPDYYAAADLLVYPYRAITTSGALLTGLSYGIPIVASRLPAFQALLSHGLNAALVPPDDPEALSATLGPLLAQVRRDRQPLPHALHPALHYGTLFAGAAGNHHRYPSWQHIASLTQALYTRLQRAPGMQPLA